MTRSHNIVLGLPKERLPADAAAEARRAGMHWRRWRRGGAAISAGIHGLLALLIVAGWPQLGAQAEKEKEPPVTVEIVQKPPEPEKPAEPPPKKEEAKKVEPELPKKPELPEKLELPKKPEPPKQQAALPPEKPQPPAAKATPEPPAPPPQAAAPPTPPAAPPAAPGAQASPPLRPEWKWEAPAEPPQMAELPTQLGPAPRAAPAPGGEKQEPDGGLKVEPDVVALPEQKKEKEKEKEKEFDHWVLDPLTLDLRDKCGVARISAVIEIKERVAEGQYRGTLRNTVRWARCPPTGTTYHVELRFSGSEVALIGAEGFTDRGVMRNGVMMLEDAYGRSVWRKR